jgi:type I restriction enzyme S subunit
VSQVQRTVGWVGKRPFDTYLAPLKSVLRIRREINSPIKSERILSLTNDRGVIPYEEKGAIGNNVSEDISRYSIVHIGDIVMNSMNVIIGSVGLSRYDGALSPVYYVLQPVSKDQIDMRYFAYHFGMPAFYKQLARIGYGILEHRMRIPWINLQNELMFVPPIAKQKVIADYLDRETVRIDALIEKKQRMIQLLDEHLKCLIDCELKSNARIPLKYLVWFQEGPGIMAEDFLDEGTPLVRVSGVGGEYVTLDGCNYLDPQKVSKKWAHFALEDGDYVISASATMGVASKVDSEAIGSIPYTGLIRFKPLSDKVEMEFIRYFLVSSDFMHQIDKLKTGAAMQHFGPIHLGQISIPHLAVGDQIRIAGKLAETDRARKEMKDLLVKQISLLEERRRAMITDAVTGVLAIPEVAA